MYKNYHLHEFYSRMARPEVKGLSLTGAEGGHRLSTKGRRYYLGGTLRALGAAEAAGEERACRERERAARPQVRGML